MHFRYILRAILIFMVPSHLIQESGKAPLLDRFPFVLDVAVKPRASSQKESPGQSLSLRKLSLGVGRAEPAGNKSRLPRFG